MKRETSIRVQLCLYAVLGLLSYDGFAQNRLQVFKSGGIINSYFLSDIKRITFTENEMMLEAQTLESHEITDIDKMLLGSNVSNFPDKNTSVVKLYPNPTSGSFTVESTSQIEELKIFDTRGRLMFKSNPKEMQCSIHLTNIPAGMYSVQIRMAQGFSISKLIKK